MYKVGENGYSADGIVGIKSDGSALHYDLVGINHKGITEAPFSRVSKSSPSRKNTSVTKKTIPQPASKSNTSNENNLEGRKSKDDTIYDIDEDELWSDYEETHALDEIDPETGWTVGELFLYI